MEERTEYQYSARIVDMISGDTHRNKEIYCFPKKKTAVASKVPWMTNEIKRKIRRKRHSWKTFKTHNMAENREKYYELEKKTKNIFKNAKRGL